MRKFTILCLLLALSVVPAFASVNSDIADAKDEINQVIEQESDKLLAETNPAGTIYITTEDIDASEVKARLGGKWREITNTFLWAKGDEDIPDRGGDKEYIFTSMIEDGEFVTDPDSTYVTDNKTEASILMGAEIVQGNAYVLSTGPVEIMPPYTVVRVFQRANPGISDPDLTWSIKSGDGFVSESTLYFSDTITLKVETDSDGVITTEGMEAEVNGKEITVTMGDEPNYTLLITVLGTDDYTSKTIEIPVVRSGS